MNINLYTTAMIYKALQTIAFFIIAIPLTGQDMFPVRQLTLDPAQRYSKVLPNTRKMVPTVIPSSRNGRLMERR